jgi:hypothetical protein
MIGRFGHRVWAGETGPAPNGLISVQGRACLEAEVPTLGRLFVEWSDRADP